MYFKCDCPEKVSLALIALIGITACSNKSGVVNNGSLQSSSVVTFNIEIPQGDPVTYGDPIHDVSEWSIESLWLYEFDSSDVLVSEPVNIKANLTGVGPKFAYEQTFSPEELQGIADGVLRCLLVANEPVPDGVAKGTAKSTLMEKLASRQLTEGASSKVLLNDFGGQLYIPMTGEAKQDGSADIHIGTSKAVKVELTRIVARFDITNNAPDLVITGVRVKNAASSSRIFEPQTPATPTRVNGITPFGELPEPFGSGKSLAKGFYLYEDGGSTDKTDVLHLEVTGKLLGDHDVTYDIPFMKAGEVIPIKRNYIYKLVLGDGIPINNVEDLKFTVKVLDWNTLDVKVGLPVLAIDPDHFDSGLHFEIDEENYSQEKILIHLNNTSLDCNGEFLVNGLYDFNPDDLRIVLPDDTPEEFSQCFELNEKRLKVNFAPVFDMLVENKEYKVTLVDTKHPGASLTFTVIPIVITA